jgi:hypothetical protein
MFPRFFGFGVLALEVSECHIQRFAAIGFASHYSKVPEANFWIAPTTRGPVKQNGFLATAGGS